MNVRAEKERRESHKIAIEESQLKVALEKSQLELLGFVKQ